MTSLSFSDNLTTYQQLNDRYRESHRHYHTSEHISAMLNHFDGIRNQLNKPELVELAIWFHDAIYNPFKSDNEERSAIWAAEFLRSNNTEVEDQEFVHQLIMATCHNENVEVQNDDAKYLVDIDLSILGARAEVYQAYEKAIRKEYRWVPWIIYRKKRKELLKSFKNQPSLYLTEYFYNQFNSRAIDNINRAIEQL